jgi:hypothetical protein
MSRRAVSFTFIVATLVALAPAARADQIERLALVASCQRKIASAGGRFAMQVIKETLKCTGAVSECQLQCEAGVFGPPCDSNPPPVPPGCCDSDDRTSNSAFDACMTDADQTCADADVKIATHETKKQERITAGCTPLTTEELCGSQGNGLNFATLNAGCLALNPAYQCSLPNLIACVGGPLERQLVDQISGLLDGRAGDAVAALNLESVFPGIPVPRKVKGQIAQGKQDVYSFSGQAGDEVRIRVITRDDNGNNTSNLQPVLMLLSNDQATPIADTNVRAVPCGVPNVCGGSCPTLKRTLPFSGTFYMTIRAAGSGGCTGGKYKAIVVSPGGTIPTLVGDDVDP